MRLLNPGQIFRTIRSSEDRQTDYRAIVPFVMTSCSHGPLKSVATPHGDSKVLKEQPRLANRSSTLLLQRAARLRILSPLKYQGQLIKSSFTR